MQWKWSAKLEVQRLQYLTFHLTYLCLWVCIIGDVHKVGNLRSIHLLILWCNPHWRHANQLQLSFQHILQLQPMIHDTHRTTEMNVKNQFCTSSNNSSSEREGKCLIKYTRTSQYTAHQEMDCTFYLYFAGGQDYTLLIMKCSKQAQKCPMNVNIKTHLQLSFLSDSNCMQYYLAFVYPNCYVTKDVTTNYSIGDRIIWLSNSHAV